MEEFQNVESKILTIRGLPVMLDRDLAELYGVETKRLNEQVRRNIERFPESFRFQITTNELSEVVANCDHLKMLKFSPVPHYAFTEQGVAMLSAILRSEKAIQVSIQIMEAFVAMRRYIMSNAQLIYRLDSVENKILEHDKKLDELFSKMEQPALEPTQGIFFQGQIFDAYAFFESIIQKVEKEIVLIDNYVDINVLQWLSKKRANVKVTIYTKAQTPLSAYDVRQFNKQYPKLEVRHTENMHDRFLIIDGQQLYHIGASLKDLGKKCFAFSLMEDGATIVPQILGRV